MDQIRKIFGDVFPLISDLQDLLRVTGSFAVLAQELDICQELHFHRNRPSSLTVFTSATGNVERKVSWGQIAGTGLSLGREDLAYLIEDLDVSHRVGSRRPANRGLIDQQDLTQLFFRAFAD